MKAIHANRFIPSTAITRRADITRVTSSVQVLGTLRGRHANVDGREHFAVPLLGPKHKPGTAYLIAHFSLPPPKEREALLDELALTFARSAVDELLRKSSRGTATD